MSRLFAAYRAVHQQGFLPIFVHDEWDSQALLDGCLAAGVKAIEYTLRRGDAHRMIPRIRERYPELYLLAGSTLDDEAIVAQARRRHPQLLTVAELEAMDVDGFVSMIGWSERSIRQYAPRRIVIPTAMTINEAFFQVAAGAHFAKLSGADLGLVSRCRAAATFDFCPIMVTGGVTLERIGQVVAAGAVLLASGFDVMLKGEPKDVAVEKVAAVVRRYVGAAQSERAKRWPQLAQAAEADPQAWLDRLPHHHPF